MAFTIDFLDQTGGISHFDLIVCGDEAEARSIAEHSLERSSTAVGVRIWSDQQCVAELTRRPRMGRR